MVQRHTIVLWKYADKEKKDFSELSKYAYEIIGLLRKYPTGIQPNFLQANTKKEVKTFDWDYNNFYELLEKGINAENGNVFSELGYTISFFSSLNEEESSSIKLHVGDIKNKNILIIDLPISFNLFEKTNAIIVRNLFKDLVMKFEPFWGCVSNRVLSRKYGKYLDGNLPTTIHWINYWNDTIINEIGNKKIMSILKKYPYILFDNGILSIKDTALNVEDLEDMNYHEELQKILVF